LPVRKVGENCYQWGNQKVYCGVGAYQKAMKQGNAIYLTGWREAETDESEDEELLEIRDMSKEELEDWPIDFSFLPHAYEQGDNPLFLINNRYFTFKRAGQNKPKGNFVWVVWDVEKRKYVKWNFSGGPLTNYYFEKAESPFYGDYLTYDDMITHIGYVVERNQGKIDELWSQWESGSQSADAVWLMTEAEAKALRGRMNDEEKEMNRHPNRSWSWIPNRIRREATAEIMADLACKKCGFRSFSSLEQAKRHKHFCEKYGVQPENGFFFTPMALELIRLGILGDSLDNKTNNE